MFAKRAFPGRWRRRDYTSVDWPPIVTILPMAKKTLTAAERLVDEQMLAMLEWASERPDKWHNIGKLEATQRAAELLEKRGVIEI
jgi:hypothetical protein